MKKVEKSFSETRYLFLLPSVALLKGRVKRTELKGEKLSLVCLSARVKVRKMLSIDSAAKEEKG